MLDLVRREQAQIAVHLGDFDYEDNPSAWEAQIDETLGPSFPYFAVPGNHDIERWRDYRGLLLQRLSRVQGCRLDGDYGVNAVCEYMGLTFILSGAGTLGSGHASYVRQQLAKSQSIWKVCCWHKNQREMQVGGKGDEVDWDVYEAAREGGAIIATAHEHSYHRTKTLSSIREQAVDLEWSSPEAMRVGGGSTFVFVSGLGGHSVREQNRCQPTKPPFGCSSEWAAMYTANQDAKFGALFIDFNVDGRADRARGYFKNIAGEIVDSFTIHAVGA